MATAKELLSWAASQIGVKESPAGSNRVKYWDTYKANTGVNLQGNPWCAAFVSCGMWHVGLWPKGKDEGRFRYCPSLVNWAKANGAWIDRSGKPKAGDIVLFANNGTACHVGFVEKVLSDGKLQTIEGNTSVTSNDNGGAVMRRNRQYGDVGSKWYVLGFVRPKFSATTSTAKKSAVEIAQEIWTGKGNWGTGDTRRKNVEAAGASYDEVQAELKRISDADKAETASKPAQKPSASSKLGTYTITTASGVNVRVKANVGASKVDAYQKGKKVKVTQTYTDSDGNLWGKTDKGWFAIKYHGSTYAKKS